MSDYPNYTKAELLAAIRGGDAVIASLEAEVAQLRATNARLTAALNTLRLDCCFCDPLFGADDRCSVCDQVKLLTSPDASQDLACIRTALDECERIALSLFEDGRNPTYAIEALAALRARFGDGK